MKGKTTYVQSTVTNNLCNHDFITIVIIDDFITIVIIAQTRIQRDLSCQVYRQLSSVPSTVTPQFSDPASPCLATS